MSVCDWITPFKIGDMCLVKKEIYGEFWYKNYAQHVCFEECSATYFYWNTMIWLLGSYPSLS